MKTQGRRRTLQGMVMSNKMDKTIVVQVERTIMHTTYRKYIRSRSKYMAHDPQNQCGIGDKVVIVESRPMSRGKRWVLREILEKAL